MEQEKLDEIKHILSVKRTASVNELAEKLYVSTATVRRALNILEKDGVLKRTHGGAVRVKNPDDESAFNARLLLNQPLKKRVAAAPPYCSKTMRQFLWIRAARWAASCPFWRTSTA